MKKSSALLLRIVLCIYLLFNGSAIAKAFSQLPDTGQTVSTTETFGEDSDYEINPPSYTKLDANGNELPDDAGTWTMVRDNNTGLFWEAKTDDEGLQDKDNRYLWAEADVYVAELNAQNYGGFADWRVPQLKELELLIDWEAGDLFGGVLYIDPVFFPNTNSYPHYLTSTGYAPGGGYRWIVDFRNATKSESTNSGGKYLRAVRGEIVTNDFKDNADGSVTDLSTELMWEQKADDGGLNDKDNTYTWEEALAWAQELNNQNYLGYNDWRIPNINELKSIVDYSTKMPAIETDFFPNTQSFPNTPSIDKAYYISSTSIPFRLEKEKLIDFNVGYERDDGVNMNKNSRWFVRAVRTVSDPANTEVLIPDTAQTQSYTHRFGEDSDYFINEPSYQKLDASGSEISNQASSWAMVRDNHTGLIWEVKTDDDSIQDKDQKFTWYDDNLETNGGDAGVSGDGTDTQDYINTLNTSAFGGYTDWRLPSAKELITIVNYSDQNPTVDTAFFPNTVYANYEKYWTSQTSFINSSAYYVNFQNGDVKDNGRLNAYSVRAVRGTPLENDFVGNGDGTLTDTTTLLTWQTSKASGKTWEQAIAYCENLDLAGKTDWRLPNVKEFASVLDSCENYSCIDQDFFPNTGSTNVWTSTNSINSYDNAYNAYMKYGRIFTFKKSNTFSVHCVRGGTSPTVNNRPNMPSNPTPALSEEDTEVELTLAWEGSDPDEDDSLVYDVYLGKTNLMDLIGSGVTATTFPLQGLEHETRYYWKVIARDSEGAETTGPRWNFVTKEEVIFVDLDFDGINDAEDNCPHYYNPEQEDENNNAIGDKCENLAEIYTDNGDGTVLDNETGLIWQKLDDGVFRTGDEAIEYCENLSLGGEVDWRLPRIDELATIIDFEKANPAIDPVFSGKSRSFWSSTEFWDDATSLWIVNFAEGQMETTQKIGGGENLSRCVANGPLWQIDPSAHLIVQNDDIVVDTVTELMWQRDDSASADTPAQAFEICENLDLDQHTDWRLPSINELFSISNYADSPIVNTEIFSTAGSRNLTSTVVQTYADTDLWSVDADSGFTDFDNMGNIRCVRDYTPGDITENVLEDGEDENTLGWEILDNDPAGAAIENVFDAGRNSRVIQLTGTKAQNAFRLRNPDGSKWQKTDNFVIEWSGQFDSWFSIHVEVKTNEGNKALTYVPKNEDPEPGSWASKHALGVAAKDGTWQTFRRDLQADLSEYKDLTILEVNGFRVRGNGLIDEVKLLSELGDWDSDQDGLSDVLERETYQTSLVLKDTDGDKIDDAEELEFWGSDWQTDFDNDGLNNLQDKDSDNDGFDDGVELQMETDPDDAEDLPEFVVYEDAEEENTLGWEILDDDPVGATIENVFDAERNSRVIELTGTKAQNAFRLRNPDGTKWQNENQFMLEWSGKFESWFAIHVEVKTNEGNKALTYVPKNEDPAPGNWASKHGLGVAAKDGTWQTFQRDLQADMSKYKDLTILEVNGFRVRGNGYIDDVKLLPREEDSDSDHTASIGTGGGTLEVQDPDSPLNGIAVEIPAEALEESKNITISLLNKQLSIPDNYLTIREHVNFGPDETSFNQPVTLTLTYPDQDNDGIVDGTNFSEIYLGAWYHNETTQEWEKLIIENHDTEENTIQIKVNHFSIYSLFLPQSEAQGLNHTLDIDSGISDYYDDNAREYDSVYAKITNLKQYPANPEDEFDEAVKNYSNASGSLLENDGRVFISFWIDSSWYDNLSNTGSSSFNTVYDKFARKDNKGVFEVISTPDEEGTLRGTYNQNAYYFSYDVLNDKNGNAITLKQWVDYLVKIKNKYEPIQRLTFFSHGNNAVISFSENEDLITLSSLSNPNHEHYKQFKRLKNEGILAEDAHILLFPCSVAGGENGVNFIKAMQDLTGATIHANSEYTGEPKDANTLWDRYNVGKTGSDWDLNIVCTQTECRDNSTYSLIDFPANNSENIGPNGIFFVWKNLEEATKYCLTVFDEEAMELVVDTCELTTHGYHLNLQPNRPYSWNVKAKNEKDKVFATSNWWNFTTGNDSSDILDLSDLEGNINLFDINDSNRIIGSSYFDDVLRGFIWDSTNGQQYLGEKVIPQAINNNGKVVGGLLLPTNQSQAFTWSNTEGVQNIPLPENGNSRAIDINNSGQVIGNYFTGDFENMVNIVQYGFIWDANSEVVELGINVLPMVINNSGQVTGIHFFEDEWQTFLWDSENGIQNLGIIDGYPTDLSDSGVIAGTQESNFFIWDTEHGYGNMGPYENIQPYENRRKVLLKSINGALHILRQENSEAVLMIENGEMKTFDASELEPSQALTYFLNSLGEVIQVIIPYSAPVPM